MAHRTTRDYVCNTIGQAAWGGLFPLLTIVCTQLVGAEQAGYFSMAFVVGTLLLFLGNYGVRTYQVSDLDEMESFYDYQLNRVITCVAMKVGSDVYYLTDVNYEAWRAQDTSRRNSKNHFVDCSELVSTVSEFLSLPFIHDGQRVHQAPERARRAHRALLRPRADQ